MGVKKLMTDSQDHVNLFYLKLGSETKVCFVMKSLLIYISVFVILYGIYLFFWIGSEILVWCWQLFTPGCRMLRT